MQPSAANAAAGNAGATWQWPSKVPTKVGAVGLANILRWWMQVGLPSTSGDGRLCWVSGLQLYIDYNLTFGTGPLYINRKWFDEGSPAMPSLPNFLKRTHSFMKLLLQLWAGNGLSVPTKYVRCAGVNVLKRFCCYRLGWSDSRISIIDRELFRVLGRQVVTPKDVEAIPGLAPLAEWALA